MIVPTEILSICRPYIRGFVASLSDLLRFNVVGKFCFFMFNFAWKSGKSVVLVVPTLCIILAGFLVNSRRET